MGDYESRLYDVQMEFNSLCDRINRRDASLCDEDWCSITNDFDLGWIEAIYKNIKADDMFDVITELICRQYSTMVIKGQIDDSIPHINEAGMVINYPEYYLNKFRDDIRSQRAAEELECKTRHELKLKMMQMKKEVQGKKLQTSIYNDFDIIQDVKNQPKKDTDSLSLQIDRGLHILRNLNDLAELNVDNMSNLVKIYDDQKFYDENKLRVLETNVKNWQSETETCLVLKGILIDKDNPFQTQFYLTRMVDKRKALANEVQLGLRFLSRLIDTSNNSEQKLVNILKYEATDADIDEIIADDAKQVKGQNIDEEEFVENLSLVDQLIIKAVEIMKKEKVIKRRYDFAFIMMIMNETEDLPKFNSPKSFLNYFKELKITGLPGEDSIKKKVNATFGNHPSWTFTDAKGKDSHEAKRRIAVGSRFLSIYRKGK